MATAGPTFLHIAFNPAFSFLDYVPTSRPGKNNCTTTTIPFPLLSTGVKVLLLHKNGCQFKFNYNNFSCMRKLNVYKHYTQAVNLAQIALRVNVVLTKKNLMISRKMEAKKNVKKEINQCARCVVVIGKLLDNISDNNHIKIIIYYYNVFLNWYLVLFLSFFTIMFIKIVY